VKVTDARTGKSVVVRINDRGPFIKGRVIDLSRAAAKEIGLTKKGVSPVKVEVLSVPKRRGS
jgi:rare lipoprotein A